MESFDVKLLRRSIGQRRIHQSVKPLYGDRTWVKDLDIVNELGGHTGCVNALSWATGGNLLASGSDDTYLNIWEYNPTNTARPFTLSTSISTGHHANIFSVKFMPHSGDRTVVSCAGDSQVRVFDIEYAGADRSAVDGGASTRSRRYNTFFPNARWLTQANTNARVYRSHADRAKRIVTESSPHLFLSCSEDGEVRQWDLRQPSEAYPSPHGSRRLGRLRMMSNIDDDVLSDNVPPPLISYKKYGLDINTISCSSSQPHYIALGGAHLHCFLHDRRMLGRDILSERGDPGVKTPVADTADDQIMREATKCVRRFAPNNKRKMRPGLRNSGHITACKISDARPNELIASWSSDHIYSFDIVKSPDARETDIRQDRVWQRSYLRNQSDRKRKRVAQAEVSPSAMGEDASEGNPLRRVANERQEDGHTALRIRHGNGDAEDIAVDAGSELAALAAHDSLLTEAQKQAQRVAKSLVRLRETLFDFSAVLNGDDSISMEGSSELTPFTANFTNALGQASVLLPSMEEIMSEWTYPVNPTPDEVELQNTLRRNRQSAWRFVQAAGVLSRAMGGKLMTMSSAPNPALAQFEMIKPAPREKITDKARFCYDFLKAILLWIDGGSDSVLRGFKPPLGSSNESLRFFCNDDDNTATMLEKLKRRLSELADEDKAVLDLEKNRFLVDDERTVFRNQEQAVSAFVRALAGIELRMHQGMSEPGVYSAGSAKRVMDKGAAARFWGVKVGRSLLMEAASGVNFAFVQQAFGGSRVRVTSDPDAFGEEELETAFEVLVGDSAGQALASSSSDSSSLAVTAPENAESEVDIGMLDAPTIGLNSAVEMEEREQSIILEEEDEDDDDEGNSNDDDNEDEDESSDDNDEDDESDGEVQFSFHRSRLNIGHPRHRATVNLDVPYSTHTKVYKGHCNTRTVKDVNYYGLDDEYVVSGSDDGNFFIWDRRSCQVLNILEGDGEVVNVVQGHPYEPMIACSGIDSTVKIFGPGGNSRERYRAARGIDVANPGGSVHSSLRSGGRPRRAATFDSMDETTKAANENESLAEKAESDAEEGKEERVTTHGLTSRKAIHRMYEIMSQNDAERNRGVDEISITDAMLARVAAALQHRQMQGIITDQGLGGAGGTIVVDQDNCTIM